MPRRRQVNQGESDKDAVQSKSGDADQNAQTQDFAPNPKRGTFVGHTLAAGAGLCGALAATSAKLAMATDSAHKMCVHVTSHLDYDRSDSACTAILLYLRGGCFGLVFLFNAIMWTLFVRSLQSCSSTLVATVTNSGTNIFCTAVIGWLLFEESLTLTWFCGASLIVTGLILIHHGSPQQHTEPDPPH